MQKSFLLQASLPSIHSDARKSLLQDHLDKMLKSDLFHPWLLSEKGTPVEEVWKEAVLAMASH
jgi:hypothetical protein